MHQLINRYNAQKSYLGDAAQWYGELSWWLKITVSMMAAGLAILFAIPWIISVAVSLVVSFLLFHHYHSSAERDELIFLDLQAQNESVQQSLLLLNQTKTELEQTLQSLCRMNSQMGAENQRLRSNIDTLTQQATQLRAQTDVLQSTIHDLERTNTQLKTSLLAGNEQLKQYEQRLADGTERFSQNVTVLHDATQRFDEVTRTAAEATEQWVSRITSPQRVQQQTQGSPEDDRTLRHAQNILAEIEPGSLDRALEDAKALTPPRNRLEGT